MPTRIQYMVIGIVCLQHTSGTSALVYIESRLFKVSPPSWMELLLATKGLLHSVEKLLYNNMNYPSSVDNVALIGDLPWKTQRIHTSPISLLSFYRVRDRNAPYPLQK